MYQFFDVHQGYRVLTHSHIGSNAEDKSHNAGN